MSTNSTRTSCDKLIELILKWKGKGLRFHLRLSNNKPLFWFSEIPDEIVEEVRELYADSVDELLKRFTPPSEENIKVDFSGGDLFSALQSATQQTVVDYDLIKELNSKEKYLDPPWKWKPCEKTQVPCAIGTTCFGNAYWAAKRDKKPINIPEVRQCPYMWKLDNWWKCECKGWNMQPVMHEGRLQYLIEGETYWELATRRKREIAEEVQGVLLLRAKTRTLDEDMEIAREIDHDGFIEETQDVDFNPIEE